MISKVNMPEKIQKKLKFLHFNICPNILYVAANADTNTDADAGAYTSKAIALLY